MSPAADPSEGKIQAGDMRWHVASAGPSSGTAVVFLHGFPEYWRTWAPQLDAVGAAGYRAYAPDLPGYGGTQEPASYAIDDLTDDIADLCTELSDRPVHLVGHDWGGMIGHAVAARNGDKIRSLTAAAAPHPSTFSGALSDPLQVMKSWYVGFFQVPYVEGLIGTRERIERAAPDCVTAIDSAPEMGRALAYYRENLRPWGLNRVKVGRIPQPGLVMHGDHDRYIGAKLMEETAKLFDDLRAFHRFDAGHFFHREQADRFNARLLEFLHAV